MSARTVLLLTQAGFLLSGVCLGSLIHLAFRRRVARFTVLRPDGHPDGVLSITGRVSPETAEGIRAAFVFARSIDLARAERMRKRAPQASAPVVPDKAREDQSAWVKASAESVLARRAQALDQQATELHPSPTSARGPVGGMSELDALAREHGIDPDALDALVKARALMRVLRDLVGVLTVSASRRRSRCAERVVGGMSELDALAREHGIDPDALDALVKARALMRGLRDLVGVLTVSAVLPPEVLADAASLSAAGVEGRADASDDEVPQGQGDGQLARDRDAADDVVVGVARSAHESSPSVGRSRVAARSVVGAPGAVAPGAGVPTVGDPADSPLSPPSVGGSVGPVGDDGPSLSSPTGAHGAGDLS